MRTLLIECDSGLEAAIDHAPDVPAVFVVRLGGEGARPYLARTTRLRRRLRRLLIQRPGAGRSLNLRGAAERVECLLTASQLESALAFYRLARDLFPGEYPRMIRLRPAPWVKLLLANEFPRTVVTTQLSSSARALHYGPFRSRAGAERFEQEVLDLFQVRRCQEDLSPSPAHPGCIYGEMNRCCRPCQMAVSADEYRHEAERLADFLRSGGAHLMETAAAARDRWSAELEFEEARRQHQRLQRIEQVLRLRDELAAEFSQLCGVAVLPSVEPGRVNLQFLREGAWLPAVEFNVAAQSGAMVPLDRRLREVVESLAPPQAGIRERQEHVAILARWFYSTWRDAGWIAFPSLAALPYRKLVRAISRVAAGSTGSLFEGAGPGDARLEV